MKASPDAEEPEKDEHHAPSSSPEGIRVISFDNSKAGLQSVDKRKTEAIITEISQGSSFYVNEQRKARMRQQRLDKLLTKSRYFESIIMKDQRLLRPWQQKVDSLGTTLEASRQLHRIYAHLDMDMFYAAVEEKKCPKLETVPLGVGGQSMLSTTNYIARQFGVRAGMPGFVGQKLCPQLVIVPLDFPSYKAEAKVVRTIAAAYDPNFFSMGLDELTMDLTNYIDTYMAASQPTSSGSSPLAEDMASKMEAKYAAAEIIMEECRQRVHAATQLTASAGIGPTGTLAKIASNYKKPNGQHTLKLYTREAVLDFMHSLPLRQVPGIGKSQEGLISGLGMSTMGHVLEQRVRLCYLLPAKSFSFLFSASLGLHGMFDEVAERQREDPEVGDSNDGESLEAGRKSIGQESTFYGLKCRLELQAVANRHLATSHASMVKEGLVCGHLVLKLKHRSFQVHQYSAPLPSHTDDLVVLQRALDRLLLPVVDAFADYRLLGVRLEKLLTKDKWRSLQNLNMGQRRLSDCFRTDLLLRKRKRGADDGSTSQEVTVLSSSSQLENEDNDDVEYVVDESLSDCSSLSLDPDVIVIENDDSDEKI